MADSENLLHELQAYRSALGTHIVQVQDYILELDEPWRAFSFVYEGDAAEEFKVSWTRTLEGFQEYINNMQKTIVILDERIEALQQASATQETSL